MSWFVDVMDGYTGTPATRAHATAAVRLRQWSVEQAVAAGSSAHDVPRDAQTILDWVSRPTPLALLDD